jgi:hypothetical protein
MPKTGRTAPLPKCATPSKHAWKKLPPNREKGNASKRVWWSLLDQRRDLNTRRLTMSPSEFDRACRRIELQLLSSGINFEDRSTMFSGGITTSMCTTVSGDAQARVVVVNKCLNRNNSSDQGKDIEYVDDIANDGSLFVTQPESADRSDTPQALKLARAKDKETEIMVFIGHDSKSVFAPPTGYVFAGFYKVNSICVVYPRGSTAGVNPLKQFHLLRLPDNPFELFRWREISSQAVDVCRTEITSTSTITNSGTTMMHLPASVVHPTNTTTNIDLFTSTIDRVSTALAGQDNSTDNSTDSIPTPPTRPAASSSLPTCYKIPKIPRFIGDDDV